MTTLLLDAGNSSLKWALFRDGRLEVGAPLVYQGSSLDRQLKFAWQSFIDKNFELTEIVLANVAGRQVSDALEQWREEFANNADVVQENRTLTIKNVVAQSNAYGVRSVYQHPEKLGADRWAALVAAQHYMEGDICVVDCGTAQTIDILSADGEHKGGVISPGWDMMKNSLVTKTNGLSSGVSTSPELLGKETREAIQAGISASGVGAVEYIVRRYQQENGVSLTCVVTGGGASRLLEKLSGTLTAKYLHDPDWVLKGLAVISGDSVIDVVPHGMGEMA